MRNEPDDSARPIKAALARVPLADIPDFGAISLYVSFPSGRQSVVVTRRGDSVTAFINRCPHARWPLDTFDGRFLFTPDNNLVCAAHGAVFDPMSGACLGGPGTGEALTAISTTRDGDEIILTASSLSL